MKQSDDKLLQHQKCENEKKVRVNEMITMHWIKLGIAVHLKTIIL